MEGAQVLLEPDAAQAIAVTLHELATNAAKYGGLSTPTGRIDLRWVHEADGRLILRWTEMGGPAVQPPTRRGFGRRVVEEMIKQLKGQTHFDWRVEGPRLRDHAPGVKSRRGGCVARRPVRARCPAGAGCFLTDRPKTRMHLERGAPIQALRC
jgi:hypothetical protein